MMPTCNNFNSKAAAAGEAFTDEIIRAAQEVLGRHAMQDSDWERLAELIQERLSISVAVTSR